MSWEVMSDEIRSCNCGRGNIRHINKMDDWNRTKDTDYIDCKECYQKFLSSKNNSYSCPDRIKYDHTNYIYVNDVNSFK